MIKKVGIVGCGTMGAGIAQVVLEAGYGVVVREIDASLLDKGIKAIQKGLERSVEKGILITKKKKKHLFIFRVPLLWKILKIVTSLSKLFLKIFKLRKSFLRSLDRICPRETIFASNTSSLSITEMASATKRPERVIGLHFFNPVQVMPLVEVVKTIATPHEVLKVACRLYSSL